MPGTPLPYDALPNIDALASLPAIEAALKKTDAQAQETEALLDALLQTATQSSSARSQTLSKSAQLAAAIATDAEDLASLLSSAARKATNAVAPIRSLDVVLIRAQDALAWADDILTLRVCAEGAKTSLSADDLPAAARHVQTYLTLGQTVREDTASAAAVSQIEQSIAELSRKVKEAADRTLVEPQLTVAQAIDAVKLFVPIGLREDGLSRLTVHLKATVKREIDQDIRSMLLDATEGSGVDEPHILVLARLFESVAGVLHDAQPKLVELFGGIAVGTVIKAVQQTCDASADRIMERYKDKMRVDDILRTIRSETANARDLDALLNEMTLLSQRMSAYFSFLQQRRQVEQLDETHAKELSDMVDKVLETCELNRRRKELGGYYNAIETYFMRENARLAIRIDESNGEDADTSTAVDDFFFVMQKCFQRAFAFGDTQHDVLRIVLPQISDCLVNDLLAYMKRRLTETEAALEKLFGNAAVTMSALPTATLTVSYLTELAKANITIPGGNENESQDGDVAKYDFFIALNNAAVSADYALRLRSNVEKAVQSSAGLSAEQRTLLGAPIAQITDAARAMTLASEHGVSRLASVLMGTANDFVASSLKEASYVVTEAQYSLDSDATPSFSREVAQQIETKVLSPSLEKRLTEKNWDALVRQVAEWFAQKIETTIFLPPTTGLLHPKPFNAFGGLRADRDVRAISAYFSNKSRRSTVRDVFGRLSQLATLVNLERPAEIYDIWGPNAGGMTWRLSSTEVRRTLTLRTDFNQEAVRSLKL